MENCVFCNAFENERIIYKDMFWTGVYDSFPVSEGHVLLIPNRHCETFFDLNKEELEVLPDVIERVKSLLDIYYSPTGYNIGANCGKSAGQTVMHCHIHIIPRYDGDVEDPRGGVRGVIPDKQKY